MVDKKIEGILKEFVNKYPEEHKVQTKWGEPLVAFADAADRRFLKLKKTISPSHALPTDFLKDAKTVISYFIPFSESTVKSNIGGRESSRQWAEAYIDTNQLILDINKHLKNELARIGYESVIIPATHNFDKCKLISDWSHRHVAAIAGLGGFGLNNMLITEKGCCGRVGSMVTNLKITPMMNNKKEYCLYKYNGSCKTCIKRCVNNALDIGEFKREKCYEMCLYNDSIFSDMNLTDVCGKCMVGVPCSFVNPVRKLKQRLR